MRTGFENAQSWLPLLEPACVRTCSIGRDARWRIGTERGVAGQLARISVPTLVATGTADRVIPATNSLRLATAIPGAWLLQFTNGGHAFMAQYPAALSNIVNEFLAL